MSKRAYPDELSFERAWQKGTPDVDPYLLGKPGGKPMFFEAADAVGRATARQGFRMFRNGGLPLIERRVEFLRQEIVVHPGPGSIPGVFEPLAVKVHVTHEGLKELRERYWVGGNRPPISVASGNMGLVAKPPAWVLWDVASGEHTPQELAGWVGSLSSEWFEHFESLEALVDEVMEGAVPLVNSADVLELVLAEYGRERAKKLLRDLVRRGAELGPRDAPLQRVDERDSVNARLDAISSSYRLR